MIEVKQTAEPFVPPMVEPTKEATVESEKVIVVPPSTPFVRAEEEDEERGDDYEIREAASSLPAYNEYMREKRGDHLTYGDW